MQKTDVILMANVHNGVHFLYNCRTILISKNEDAISILQKIYDEFDLSGLEIIRGIKDTKRKIREYTDYKATAHFIIIDLDGVDYDERLKFFEFIRRNNDTENIPILVLNRDWSHKQIKSNDEDECGEVGLEEQEDEWFTDYLTKLVNRPFEKEQMILRFGELYKRAYGNGVFNIDCKQMEKIHIYLIPCLFDKVNIKEIEVKLSESAEKKIEIVVLDFKHGGNISYQDLRILFQIIYNLRRSKMKFYSINVFEDVFQVMCQNGLSDTFNVKSSLNQILVDEKLIAASTKIKPKNDKSRKYILLNVNIIKPFIQASIRCFREELKIEMRPLKLKMCEKFECSDSTNFATVIRVTSTTFFGTISQLYSKDTFAKLCKHVALKYKISDINSIMTKIEELMMEIFKMAHEDLTVAGINIAPEEITPILVHSAISIMKEISRSKSIIIPIESSIGYIEFVVNGHSS